jgi:hypothetical protein
MAGHCGTGRVNLKSSEGDELRTKVSAKAKSKSNEKERILFYNSMQIIKVLSDLSHIKVADSRLEHTKLTHPTLP